MFLRDPFQNSQLVTGVAAGSPRDNEMKEQAMGVVPGRLGPRATGRRGKGRGTVGQ